MNTMMKRPHKAIAKIHWISAAEGGRKHPPLGPRYSTAARFAKEAKKWPQEAWSLLAEFTEARNDLYCREAEIQFLANDAPADLLEPGNKFELYEGHRLVARGEVLSSEVKPSSEMAFAHSNVVMQEINE